MQYTIDNERMSVTADSLGAELVHIRHNGKERLWQNENGSWSGHAPLLFPACGKCGITVNGKTYPLAQHGFARRREFVLTGRGDTFMEFSLCADEETRKVYPFEFVLTVTHTLLDGGVETKISVENPAPVDLYFSCGGHDSFALDGDIGEYEVLFEKEENFTRVAHDENGRLTGETVSYGRGRVFPLPADYMQEGRTVIFPNVASRALTLCKRTGEKVASLAFEGFSHVLLWHPHGSRMVCMEPWCTLPDRADENGEFCEKAGVIRVPPHGVHTFTLRKTYDCI